MKHFKKYLILVLALFAFVMLPHLSSEAASAAKVQNFRRICYGNKSVFLAWNKVSNADYYILYQYNSTTKEYDEIAKTAATNYQVKKLKVGKTYRFIVRSCRTVQGTEVLSKDSAVVKAAGKKIDISDVHGRYWGSKLRKTLKVKEVGTEKKIKVKQGTKVTTTSASGGSVVATLPNGRKIWIKGSDLDYDNLILTSSYKYYTKAQKEAYINTKGYTSDTDWILWINQYTASFNIFKGKKGTKGTWKLVRSVPCVIGAYGHTTPGTYKLLKHSKTNGKPQIYWSWNSEKNWGQSLHCLIDSKTRGAFSNGCVRLADKDLYYVVDNCPLGTTVLSF